jgi:hypothetical protein
MGENLFNLNFKNVRNIERWKFENNQYTPDLRAIDMFMQLTVVNRLKSKSDYWNFAYRLQLLFPEKDLKILLFESNVVIPYYFNNIEHQLSINDLIDIKGIEYDIYNTYKRIPNSNFENVARDLFDIKIMQYSYKESAIHFVDSSYSKETNNLPLNDELKTKSSEYADFFIQQIPSTYLIKHELNDFFFTIFSDVTYPNDPKLVENIQEYFSYNLNTPHVEIIANTILIYLNEIDDTNEKYYNLILDEINLKIEMGNIDICLDELESLTDFEIPFHLDFLLKLEEVLRLYGDDYEERLEIVRHRILRLKPELSKVMIE